MPYLKPRRHSFERLVHCFCHHDRLVLIENRTRLSADERSKLRLPGPARHSGFDSCYEFLVRHGSLVIFWRRSKAIDMGLFEPAQAHVLSALESMETQLANY